MQTFRQVAESHIKEAYALSDSPFAESVKKWVSIEDTNNAEQTFDGLLNQITDKELKEKLDKAVGRIAYAYETLGFCEGYIAEKSYACIG